MKTFKKSIFVYITGFALSVLLISCCRDMYRITGDGTFNAYDFTGVQIDTIRDSFYLKLDLEVEKIADISNLSLIQNTYAFSCDDFRNYLVDSSLTLKCNRAFQYKNDTISENSDFSNIEGLYIDFLSESSLAIFFLNSFLTNAEFEEGEYIFSIELETDDGLKLANEVTVQIEL